MRAEGLLIGFVPTMGALHAGHISLIKQSQKACNITICSIFVNPTQFNDPKDFEKYPITLSNDLMQLSEAGCDIVFVPNVSEMYPKGLNQKRKRKFGFITETLEGEFRPGHFDGMVQIVEKLLKATMPDYLYMGQKDYQQQLIVRHLIEQMGIATRLVMCPTERELDGLAMSSRNVRLNEESRLLSTHLYKALHAVQKQLAKELKSKKTGVVYAEALKQLALNHLFHFPQVELEYFEIRHRDTLQPLLKFTPKTKGVALVAAKVDGVRLIDNVLLP